MEQVSLAAYTTLHVGGPARYFAEATNEAEVEEAFRWARERGVALEPLGGGSNLLVADTGFDGLVLRMGLRGVTQEGDLLRVAAGEDWDRFVDEAIARDLAGVECLAGIPGTVGASPVQNIGAYGQEVAQTVASVRALDRSTGRFVELRNELCRFRYRRSVFNTEERGRYLLTEVRFRLQAGGAPAVRYAELQRWFEGQAGPPTLAEVAGAVRLIRSGKGMVLREGDHDTWSAGSYFKNPVVPESKVTAVAAAAGVATDAVPRWPAGEGEVKLPAAWLLERAGFSKGYGEGAARLSSKHALALTNRGGASCADLLALERTIRDGVEARFGVELEREPVMLGA